MTIGMSGYMRVEDMLTARVNELTADLIHEREAHAETQAALRAFIADLDRAKEALILAKEALAGVVSGYDLQNPLRSADFHRANCECFRCAIDRARAAFYAISALGVK